MSQEGQVIQIEEDPGVQPQPAGLRYLSQLRVTVVWQGALAFALGGEQARWDPPRGPV